MWKIGSKLFKTCLKDVTYHQIMFKVWRQYVQRLSKFCSKYIPKLLKICLKSIGNLFQYDPILSIICPMYHWNHAKESAIIRQNLPKYIGYLPKFCLKSDQNVIFEIFRITVQIMLKICSKSIESLPNNCANSVRNMFKTCPLSVYNTTQTVEILSNLVNFVDF